MALKPSLEGWKPVVFVNIEHAGNALKPSLEGWKPRARSPRLQNRRPLKPSLEGWKLPREPRSAEPAEDLETFLRGMETGVFGIAAVGDFALKPSLEGWKPLDRAGDGALGGP